MTLETRTSLPMASSGCACCSPAPESERAAPAAVEAAGCTVPAR